MKTKPESISYGGNKIQIYKSNDIGDTKGFITFSMHINLRFYP